MASLSSINRLLRRALTASPDAPPTEAPKAAPLQHALAAIQRKCPITLVHACDEHQRERLQQQLVASNLNCVALASTSLAALNYGAQTVHSFFGFEPTFIRTDRIAPSPRLQALLQHLDCIVVDNAPSLRADLLDGIDRSLRFNRDAGAPFGGVPLLLLGDFLQLPPPLGKPDAALLNELGYPTHALFAAHSLRGLAANIIRSEAEARKPDPELIDSLRKLRLRQDLDDVVARLNLRCYRKHRRPNRPLLLATRLDEIAVVHQSEFAKLRGAAQIYRGALTGSLSSQPNQRLPSPEALELKPGTRVMATKSDPAQRWLRGSLGTVKRLEPNAVQVRFDHTTHTHSVEPATWHSVRHRWNSHQRRIEARVVGAYSQVPLVPAYATTIQKAQGLRLADIRIDPGTAAFSNALGYIALASAQSLDGVSLTRPLMAWDVRIHTRFVEGFERMLESLTR